MTCTPSPAKGVRAGLFGIGLDTYWPQFPGLHDRLCGYLERIHGRLAAAGVEVVDAGLVDSVPKAREAASLFRREEADILFLYVSTYALSSTVLPVVQRAGVPVVVLNLQPEAALDYAAFNALGDRGLMTGEWLANCQACSAPEIACVFNRAGIDYHLVTGTLDDPEAWREIGAWLDAARAANGMRENRVGVLGHYYGGMLDVYSDMTQQAAVFGCHFELLEMCRLRELRDAVTDAEVEAKLAQFRGEFDVAPECSAAELARAAKTSCALDALAARHGLGAMAYYYEGAPGNEYENIVTSVIAGNSLLTAHGVPVAGECEVKNVQAMKILDLLGAGGSFSEFYLMDFADDVVLLGHDGPGHMAIADGPVKLVPLPIYHGKPGQGLSIEMKVKNGPVTLLSVVQDGAGRLKLLVAEGESVPGPILHIGNTNSRYRFPIGAKNFVNAWSAAGPAHHCAIGIGHLADTLEKLAALWKIECVRVC
ncbi:MAG TPA: L-fucose/L-arabinose isomerase family protein [Candidatus Hydrogenedentes bacterium]|nr:L-fucose/L-arabinose isomerase family protein [Candidatus Hydrogenedentota bacterium]HQL93926.1 L-fucose/L-arabinose isomerase family protein [Candidatus Hydrogenedentota bacterium]